MMRQGKSFYLRLQELEQFLEHLQSDSHPGQDRRQVCDQGDEDESQKRLNVS